MNVELQENLPREILSSYQGEKNELIPILIEVQANFGYLPEEAILLIAGFLNIAEGQIYSVASFYAQFRLTPVGRQRITVCRGTACHIRGAPQVLSGIGKEVGIEGEGTTSDLEYTLETVACIGCCALAPCIRINDAVHGEITVAKVKEILPVPNRGGQSG